MGTSQGLRGVSVCSQETSTLIKVVLIYKGSGCLSRRNEKCGGPLLFSTQNSQYTAIKVGLAIVHWTLFKEKSAMERTCYFASVIFLL